MNYTATAAMHKSDLVLLGLIVRSEERGWWMMDLEADIFRRSASLDLFTAGCIFAARREI
jgi:hypothetical protein